jgi:argininosuccinate lyase
MNQKKNEEVDELVRGGNAALESAATVLACICGSMLVLFVAILISKL